jgi:pimeloyl-ACP methyl ester carboxylesterase
LRPQPRGLGGSDGPLRGLTLHDYARDVGVVIARESAEPVVVVGHAFGNWVARMVAADLLVRGVALLAAGATLPSPPPR